MTTIDLTEPNERPPSLTVCGPTRTWRSTKSNVMSILMALSLVVVAIPLIAVIATVVGHGRGRHELVVSHQEHSRPVAAARSGHGPGDRRHPDHHGRRRGRSRFPWAFSAPST